MADEVARRLQEFNPGHDNSEALAGQIAAIYDRIDALAAKAVRADDPDPVVRELLDRLGKVEAAPSSRESETLAAFHAALGAHLSELRAEQASADRRTQTRLADLQSVLETLVTRIASIESELAGEVDDQLRPPADTAAPRPAAGAALPGVEALGPEVAQRASQATAARGVDDRSLQLASGEDFLIEPGAGAPQRAREARELAQMIRSKDQSRGQRPYRRCAARRAGVGGKRRRGGKRPRLQGRRRRSRRRWPRAAFKTPGRSTPVISAPCCSASRSRSRRQSQRAR